MDRGDEGIRAFRRQAGVLLWLKYAVGLAAGWCFVWGLAVVVLRAGWGVERGELLWGLAGVGAALLGAIVPAGRRVPGAAAVRALIDERNRLGGVYMAASEVAVGEWGSRAAGAAGPGLRWRGGRTWGLLGLGVLFVGGSFLVPQRYVEAAGARELEVGRDIEELEAKIELLEEQRVIETAEAGELAEKLEQIRQEASGEDPVKTWEALDHLEEKVEQAAQEAQQEAMQGAERLARAEAMAEAMAQAEGELEGQRLAEAMGELKEMVEEALEANEGLAEGIDGELLAKLAGAGLSREDLKRLGEGLRLSREELEELLKRLGELRLIDPESLGKCQGMCQFDPNALALALCEGGGQREGLLPGRGGVSRGRGDAAMTWKDASDEAGAKFREEVLGAASLDSLRDSRLLGVSEGAPSVKEGGSAVESGALSGAAAGGGSAHTETVLPRHRGTVGRYFGRGED